MVNYRTVCLYFVTALVPSDTACFGQFHSNNKRSTVWIGRVALHPALLSLAASRSWRCSVAPFHRSPCHDSERCYSIDFHCQTDVAWHVWQLVLSARKGDAWSAFLVWDHAPSGLLSYRFDYKWRNSHLFFVTFALTVERVTSPFSRSNVWSWQRREDGS